VPEIGPDYEEIFNETIRINTLDANLYERIQKTMIDVLDTGKYVHILGKGDNVTDLKVQLYQLQNPEKETVFENCVADVNIPVGEVFTSPVLEGTDGVLHVCKVFLDGLQYHDLKITFKDGMIVDYGCANFADTDEGRRYVKSNVLHNHESIPLGEFAIGTNTTAYVMARKYHIQDKMPILIDEKTGPHFAVGDTCYSWSEENHVYNQDGKEIVAKDNSVSILRKEDVSKYNKIIANLPYNITTEAVNYLLLNADNASKMVLMCQLEAFNRFHDLKGKDYGPTSILIHLLGESKKVLVASKGLFYPAPKIDSIVFTIDLNKNIDRNLAKQVYKFAKALFLNRRKTIYNNLRTYLKNKEVAKNVLDNLNIPLNKRPEEISYDLFLKMYNEIKNY
jgi:16S rRNA A1518/A1519 N6-dimethyltransferase RsmA/KsgA/DIM1 with predicted DNA glycosylase/AP lyase activity